jgi:hypothetical protein
MPKPYVFAACCASAVAAIDNGALSWSSYDAVTKQRHGRTPLQFAQGPELMALKERGVCVRVFSCSIDGLTLARLLQPCQP